MVGIEDPVSVAAAVERLIMQPVAEREEMLARASSMVRERYDWKKISDDMEQMFNEITT